jgi:hypothetical protein
MRVSQLLRTNWVGLEANFATEVSGQPTRKSNHAGFGPMSVICLTAR